jgi:hypothetical protein
MGVIDPLEVVDVDHDEVHGQRAARALAHRPQRKIERPAVGQPGQRIGHSIAHRATQLSAQLGELRRAPAEFRLELAVRFLFSSVAAASRPCSSSAREGIAMPG